MTERSLSASLTFPTPTPLSTGAKFRGLLKIDGVEPGLDVTGSIAASREEATLPFDIELARLPAELLSRLRLDSFDYQLTGRAGEAAVAVSGGGRWEDLSRDPGVEQSVSQFLHLRSVAVERLSLTETRARGELEVRNPFSFDLKIAGLEYRLLAESGEIGRGRGRGILLHKATTSRVELPLSVEHGPLIRAAGTALLSGGEIGGSLVGTLTIRLPAGDVKIPFAAPGKISVL